MPSGIAVFSRKLLVQPTSHGFVQFFRYGIVAIIAFTVDFGLLYVFTSIFFWFYLLSATSSFAISVAVNYVLSTTWVFAQRTKRERGTELVLFVGVCVIALLLNDIFMWIFTSVLGMFYLTSKLITVAIVLFWSFGARRLVFHADFFKRGWPRNSLRGQSEWMSERADNQVAGCAAVEDSPARGARTGSTATAERGGSPRLGDQR